MAVRGKEHVTSKCEQAHAHWAQLHACYIAVLRAMASEQGQSEAAAYKAVERVLTGAVSKILSKFGNKQGLENTRTRMLPHSSFQPDNESSDSDDFQHSGRAKKATRGKYFDEYTAVFVRSNTHAQGRWKLYTTGI